MHSYECVTRDADAMFHRKKLPLVILADMKHQICGHHTVLEGDVQSLERENVDPYRMKFPLHHRHILDLSELVMPTGSSAKHPHTADGAIAYKLW